jgi:cell wall-associated NlpC family hydrolase
MRARVHVFARRALSVLLVSTLFLPHTFLVAADAKTRKPSIAEINEAKKKEAEKKAAAERAKAKLNAASNELKILTAKAIAARNRYLQEVKKLAIATKKAEAARKKEEAAIKKSNIAQSAVIASKNHIGKVAANAYIMGSGFTDFDSILHADGPQDLMDRLSTLDAVGENNSSILLRLKVAEEAARLAKIEAEQARAEAVAARQEQADATARVAAAKKEADQARDAQEAEVKKLQKMQNQLIAELLSARKKRVTLEQQRQLAILEEALAARAEQTTGQAKIWPVNGIGFSNGRTTIRSNEEIRTKAVAYAKKQVLARKPYVWGNEGPNSFDCSGLVFAAYRSAGLGYPGWDRVNSRIYYSWTKRVPLNELLPGDLLYYSYKADISTIHHITIYAGNGMMWEAHNTRKGLLYSSIYSIPGLIPFGGRV